MWTDAARLWYASWMPLLVLAAVVGGCSFAPAPVEAPPPPVYHVRPGTWRVMDEQIYSASVHARHESEAAVRVAMDEWLWRVRQRIDAVFIPWYSDYWTQQWIGIKVSWYELQEDEGEPTAEERLVAYLQEQFSTQVLEPVSSFVDPDTVMEEATIGYLRELKVALDPLPARYHVPAAAFDQHLEAIPAIAGTGVPQQDASLYEVLQDLELPDAAAYELLLGKIAAVKGSFTPAPSAERLEAVARRAIEKLLGTLPVRGGASAASTVVGGFLGLLISTGAAAWSVMEHEHDKPLMEAQLRTNLNAVLEVMWQGLVVDGNTGVMALVHHMSTQIETAVLQPAQTPPGPLAPDPAAIF